MAECTTDCEPEEDGGAEPTAVNDRVDDWPGVAETQFVAASEDVANALTEDSADVDSTRVCSGDPEKSGLCVWSLVVCAVGDAVALGAPLSVAASEPDTVGVVVASIVAGAEPDKAGLRVASFVASADPDTRAVGVCVSTAAVVNDTLGLGVPSAVKTGVSEAATDTVDVAAPDAEELGLALGSAEKEVTDVIVVEGSDDIETVGRVDEEPEAQCVALNVCPTVNVAPST